MARLIYSAICSLDGYVEDAHGRFDWAEPDEEVFSLVNDLERPVGTYLYGRRMYETMLPWETADTSPDQPAVVKDFTRTWQAADKIVFSTTLRSVSSARTRIEHGFQPDAIRRLRTGDNGGAGGRAAPVRGSPPLSEAASEHSPITFTCRSNCRTRAALPAGSCSSPTVFSPQIAMAVLSERRFPRHKVRVTVGGGHCVPA